MAETEESLCCSSLRAILKEVKKQKITPYVGCDINEEVFNRADGFTSHQEVDLVSCPPGFSTTNPR